MRILFTPMRLLPCQKLHYMKDVEVVDGSPDLVFRWEWPMTKFSPFKNIWGVPVINERLDDVSKVKVDEIFKQVYGYSTEVNRGPAVEKPNLTNGLKDVRLVNLDNYEKKKDYFYQQFIEQTREIRLVIMDSRPVYRVDKIKKVTPDHIAGKVMSYEIMPVEKDERIERFCQLIGLDYGELDILNDVIIDVNPTPGDASFILMPPEMGKKYLEDYSNLFKLHYA